MFIWQIYISNNVNQYIVWLTLFLFSTCTCITQMKDVIFNIIKTILLFLKSLYYAYAGRLFFIIFHYLPTLINISYLILSEWTEIVANTNYHVFKLCNAIKQISRMIPSMFMRSLLSKYMNGMTLLGICFQGTFCTFFLCILWNISWSFNTNNLIYSKYLLFILICVNMWSHFSMEQQDIFLLLLTEWCTVYHVFPRLALISWTFTAYSKR